MSQQLGIDSYLFFQEEVVDGVQPTPGGFIYPIVSETLDAMRNRIKSETIRQNRNRGRSMLGNQKVSGDITLEWSSELYWFLKWIMGSVAKVDNLDGTFTYTFKVSKNVKSFMIEKGHYATNHYDRFNGCKLSGLTGDISSEGIFSISLGVTGRLHSTDTSAYDSSPTEITPKIWDNFQISVMKEGGADIDYVSSISGFKLGSELIEGKYAIDPVAPGILKGIAPNLIDVEGTLDLIFDVSSLSLLTKAINNTDSSLQMTWQRGIGDGSDDNEKLDILIPEVNYDLSIPKIPSAGPVEWSLPFWAFQQSDANNSTAVITLDCAVDYE